MLRNKTTGEFYQKDKWVLDPALAHNFPTTQSAIALVVEQQLEEVELVLQFGPEPSRVYDVCLPLFPRRKN